MDDAPRPHRVAAGVVIGLLAFVVVAGCEQEEECANDQKVDVTFEKVGDHATVTLDADDGHYLSFDASGFPWQDEKFTKLPATTGSVEGTLTLTEMDTAMANRPLLQKLHFEPADGSEPVDFTSYGCA